MMTPSLSLAVWAVAAVLALGANAQLTCNDLGPGRVCTNSQGQESRCTQTELCIANLVECPSTATLLQTCSSPSTALNDLKFCFPMLLGEGQPMQCMETVDIDTLVKRGECAGKADGTPCQSAYTEPELTTGLSANVYEEEGVCESGYCVSSFFSACNDTTIGMSCIVLGVLRADLRQFKGTCVGRTPYRPRCNITDSGVVLSSGNILIGAPPVPTAAPKRFPTPTPTPTMRTPFQTPSATPSADGDSDSSAIKLPFPLTPGSASSGAAHPPVSAMVSLAAVLSTSLVFLLL